MASCLKDCQTLWFYLSWTIAFSINSTKLWWNHYHLLYQTKTNVQQFVPVTLLLVNHMMTSLNVTFCTITSSFIITKHIIFLHATYHCSFKPLWPPFRVILSPCKCCPNIFRLQERFSVSILFNVHHNMFSNVQ